MLNHATGYSILTYYCAYYRYYYPVEFVTALLNTADNQKKILAGTALAAQRGIKIMPIRFRHSLDQYTPDVSNRAIYKGMASIKYLNKRIGRELYALRDNTYADFISLLQDIKHKTSVNSRQLQILIELDFFHEFGNPNQLKAQVELFDKYSDSIQLSKAIVDPFIDHDAMLTLCEKETEKKYINVDWLGIVRHCAKETSEIITPVSDILHYEMDNLGYLQYQNPSLASTYHYILSIDGKYKKKTRPSHCTNLQPVKPLISKSVPTPWIKTPSFKAISSRFLAPSRRAGGPAPIPAGFSPQRISIPSFINTAMYVNFSLIMAAINTVIYVVTIISSDADRFLSRDACFKLVLTAITFSWFWWFRS